MVPAADLVDRFRADLEALIAPGRPAGLAVSGGPDSLALLLLATASRPGRISAASVDHRLRDESREECEQVGTLCASIGVPHHILTVEWAERPVSGVQEKARGARYALLGQWAEERGFGAIATGHHADDQAETLCMRLARGAGVGGLAGMRAASALPGHSSIRLLRPLLGWRRHELVAICADAGLSPADDPSNGDPRFERVRVRHALAEGAAMDAAMWARSAANLAAADEAIEWAAKRAWKECAARSDDILTLRPDGLPDEIVRRLVARALTELAAEGIGEPLRGAELDRLIATLRSGGTATLRGARCSGGGQWRFVVAPPRADRR